MEPTHYTVRLVITHPLGHLISDVTAKVDGENATRVGMLAGQLAYLQEQQLAAALVGPFGRA